MTCPRLAAAVALLAGAAVAQAGRDQPAELLRMQRARERVGAEIEQLVERRFRHDLGLPSEPDPTARLGQPVSTLDKERLLRELRDAEGTTASYLSRYNDMKAALETLRDEVAARAAEQARRDQYVVVPSPGTLQRAGASRPPAEAVETQPAAPPGAAPRTAPRSIVEDDAVRLDRVRGHIQGSQDHLRVAQSLFRAGQALADAATTARAHGDDALGRELDDRGRERLERAVAELGPLLAQPEPPYAALFCQGRCLELLFRHSVRYEDLSLQRQTRLYQQREQEVREPFLAITTRDVTKPKAVGALEVLGPWGRAAQAAVEHFRWMNLHADYRPSTPIESLTWPGEKER